MPPTWFAVVSWASLAVATASASYVLADIFIRGHRQQMPVMEAVWPVTALYLGPIALMGYLRWGLPSSPRWLKEHGRDTARAKPRWASVALGVSHCGAGCTLGDIVAEWAVFSAGATLFGQALFAEFAGDFVLALALGILFQYFAIAPMRGLGLRQGLLAAAKADVLSLVAFEVGLFAWMALTAYGFFPEPHRLRPDQASYWFMMQVGMIIGFATAWPANVWLIRRGIKEKM